jgi:hypothetical protein
MNTRLLMVVRVEVGTLQNIGAMPHGTRRTAPLGVASAHATAYALIVERSEA